MTIMHRSSIHLDLGRLSIASLITANVFAVPDLTQRFEFAMLLYFPIVANETIPCRVATRQGFQF